MEFHHTILVLYLAIIIAVSVNSQNPSTIQIRLAGTGSSATQGRVEVRNNSTVPWGRVCDRNWGNKDATVACKMLGFKWGTDIWWRSFGSGSGTFYMDDVECVGNETSLTACRYGGWRTTSCSSPRYRDAAVSCSNATFQVSGGDHGVVRYREPSGWKTICDNLWDDNEAQVLCRSLGFMDGSAQCCSKLSPYTSNPYMWAPQRRSRTNFNCTGSEATLLDCPNTYKTQACPTRKVASAICYSRPKTEINMGFSLRLVNGTSDNSGVVEVTRLGLAGKICATNWTDSASAVVCRQLGFTGGISYGITTWRFDLPVWITSVNCSGQETSLDQCVASVWGLPTRWCAGQHVLCYRTAPPTVSLVGGGTYYGRVQVSFEGQTGTICDTYSSNYESRVICRQLGFTDGNYLAGSYYGPGTGPVFMDRVYCLGNEANVFGCRNRGWMNAGSVCFNHTKDLSVSCFNEVRLTRGDHSHGVAMVWISSGTSGFWRPICGNGFTNVEAKVFCQELGFQNGRVLPFGSYGRYYSRSYYGNNITCTGTETSIKNCTTTTGTCNRRSYNGYASVACYNGTLSTNTSVSLTGAVAEYAGVTGRVVVTKTGIRGRICETYWDDKDADVVCRQLGLRGGVSYQYSTIGLGPFLLSQVGCFGNETSLFDCPTGSETCSPRNFYGRDAGVLCYRNQPIRPQLVGGTATMGRVEIIYEGMTGTICSSTSSQNVAKAACRQLGFNDGIIDRSFGGGSGPVYMAYPSCYGFESSIFQCMNSGWRAGITSYCQSHASDLGVQCYKEVKLIKGSTNPNVTTGIVQFYRTGNWRTVCANGFDNNDAAVVCRELGYPYGIQLPPGAFNYHYFSRYTSLSYVNCTGSETSITQCSYSIGGCSYGYNNYAAVLCTRSSLQGFRFNITIGPTFPSRVRFTNFGITASFCSEGFTDKEAQVVCRSKGYQTGVAFGPRYYYRDTPRVAQVSCIGNETDLNDCSITTQISSACGSSYKTAQVYCMNTGLQIRLARNSGSTTVSSLSGGRVEIKIGGQWGTVCDSYFGNTNARVVCRQLGFPDGIARSYNYYGAGTGPLWFYNPYCRGNEQALWNCRFSSFNTTSSYCRNHQRDASVQCTGLVRFHTNLTYGAIEVWDGNSSYNLICADNFDDIDARVVCNEMGYQFGVRVGASAFGYQRYRIGYTNVRCTGSETSFKDCPYDVSMTYCPSGKYASAACSSANPGSGYVLSIQNTDHGRVKVRHMNIDGYICPNDFDNKAATVICREKGYVGGFGYTYNNYYPTWRSTSNMRWLSGIKCDGSETYLSQCDGVRYGDTNNCSWFGDAAVYCYRTSGLQLRLGNKTGSAGRVEFNIDGTWGTMCTLYGGYYGDNNAAVICRMLNYTDGKHLGIGTFGPGTGPIYLSRLYCSGSESSIFQCRSMWKQAYSSCAGHQLDNAVQCYDNVRLAGGGEVSYGRVEVYKNNQWTPVCDHNFDNGAARVVCRKLGFSDGKSQCCNAVGNIDASKITFVVNGCTGSETDLFSCNIGSGACTTGKYATVYCSYSQIIASAPILRLPYSYRDYGAVQMNRYGFWGPICDVGWTNNDAMVACRSMGYAGGVKFSGQSYSSAPMVVGKVNCNGRESNITQCSISDLDDNTDLGCNYPMSRYGRRNGAGVLCYDTADGGIGIRLVNGSSNHGRLEVSYKGEWGRVCRWSFSDVDAGVACRQLGFLDGSVIPVQRSTGRRTWMSYVRCTGSEQSLFECPLYWNSYYCSSDAGVVCYDSIRLSSGDQFSYGIVEVNINKNWGGVCATGWSSNDVSVSCKQLGYEKGFNLCCNAMGNHYTAVMDNVNCGGSENRLTDCTHTVPHSRYCESTAAVACYNGTVDTSTFNWRLAGGNNYTGEVLVNFINITGRICPDGWDDKDATVACKSLGFSKGQAYTHYKYTYFSNSGPFWTTSMGCSGTEVSLSDCRKTQLGTVSTCSNTHSAGILCGDNAGIYYRLRGGQDNAGRVEVSVNGVWGSVCRRYFDSREATVLCKTLGYNVGIADYITQYPNGSGPVYEADFRCTGQESSLAQCPHAGWKTSTYSYCSGHRYDAAVTCYGDVKLASGFAPDIKQGPVQVWSNNTWHYVCDTNFDDVAAKTVCKALGFVDGRALCCSAYGTKYLRYSWYGNGEGTILANQTMRCDGTQTDPMACLTPGTCSSNYASVVCFNSSDIISESYSFGFDDTTSKSGQIAVQHYGVTGRICSNFWTDTEASVFCKSLGYNNGIAYHHSVNYVYHPITSRGPFWLSGVNCTGTETSLSQCSYGNRTSLGNCSTADIASAICYNGDQGIQYRLVAPDNTTNKNYGRVEMAVGGVWGTVCDRYFDRREATVFCRQMNFKDGYAIPNAFYGQGSGPIWLSSLHCKGTESSLHQCPHSGFSSEVVSGYSYYWCRSHRDDVSVYCVDNVKLNLGLNASQGAVEIYAEDHWNAVCAEGFNTNAATVVCRTFGFSYGAKLGGSVFGRTDGHIGISQVSCTGREADFNKCTFTKSTTCKSGMYASVVCSNTQFIDNGFKLRIVQDDPASKNHGFLEAQISGIWGSVCGTGFTDRAANIACKQLGFKGGVAYSPAVLNPYYSRGQTIIKEKTPILMTQIKCTGNENGLDKCTYSPTSTNTWCDYYAPRAGVLCYQRERIQYRLAGDTTNPLQGRIEMKYDGQWGTLCNPFGNSNAARVACKGLNHVDGMPLSNSRYVVPNDNRPVWFHYFRCFGNETTLPTCRNDGFSNSASIYRYWWGSYCRRLGPVSAKCYDVEIKVTNIRLADGPTNNTGRVEIYLQGPNQWGTICDDYWDDKDATVVCMMFGYAQGKAMSRATYGQGIGPIWMDNLGCKGNESHIQDCPHNGYAIENCRHYEDAGVQCFGTLPLTTPPTTSGPGPVTQKINSSGGTPAAAIAVPIVCALLIAAAVAGFLYYRRRYQNKSDTVGLVPDIPATGVMFSKSSAPNSDPEISGVSNPNYDTPISHVDDSSNA